MTWLRGTALGLSFWIVLGDATSMAVAQTSSLPEGKGKAIVQRACAQCHAIGVVTGADHTPDDWGIVVRAMVHDGAKLAPYEQQTVIDYLAKSFPKTASQAVEAAAPPAPPEAKGLPAGY
jgi:mono/diheme cytochrome c family protein